MDENAPTRHTLAEGLAKLVGEQLSSVEFVQDYVQLRFEGPCLSAYIWPVVTFGSQSVSRGQPGYRDALCSQITHSVLRTEADEEQVSITFDGGVVISISLCDVDYRGPEALEFRLDKDHWWVV